MLFKWINGRLLIISFVWIQENRIFFKFLTLLSNLQKSESKNSNDNVWHCWLGSSKAKWNFPDSNLRHWTNFTPLNCKNAAIPISLVVNIFSLLSLAFLINRLSVSLFEGNRLFLPHLLEVLVRKLKRCPFAFFLSG